MKWPTDVMSVGQVNDEVVPLDTEVNKRLSRVCGLAVWQRVSLTLQGFNELTGNKKDELIKNSIQAYIHYLEELKQKGKKIAMMIISHAWRSYKSKHLKIWREKHSPFCKYKDLKEEDWARFVEKCELENFVMDSQYMQ
jgi:Fe2+ transport system protein B